MLLQDEIALQAFRLLHEVIVGHESLFGVDVVVHIAAIVHRQSNLSEGGLGVLLRHTDIVLRMEESHCRIVDLNTHTTAESATVQRRITGLLPAERGQAEPANKRRWMETGRGSYVQDRRASNPSKCESFEWSTCTSLLVAPPSDPSYYSILMATHTHIQSLSSGPLP